MIPGPTNVAPSVLSALARPTLSHASPAFANILTEMLSHLRKIFKTNGLILPLAGSGTLGDEIAFVLSQDMLHILEVDFCWCFIV